MHSDRSGPMPALPVILAGGLIHSEYSQGFEEWYQDQGPHTKLSKLAIDLSRRVNPVRYSSSLSGIHSRQLGRPVILYSYPQFASNPPFVRGCCRPASEGP